MEPMTDQAMQPGMNLDPNTLIEVLQNKLAQGAMREAQMESAIQQLLAENAHLNQVIEASHEPSQGEAQPMPGFPPDVVVPGPADAVMDQHTHE